MITFIYFLLTYIVEKENIMNIINRLYVAYAGLWISGLIIFDQLSGVKGSAILFVLVVVVIGTFYVAPISVLIIYFISLMMIMIGLPRVQIDNGIIANELMGIIPLFLVSYGLQLYMYRISRRDFMNEERREHEKEKIKLIIDSLPSYIFIEDIDGKIQMVNKAISNVFEKDPQYFIGRYSTEFGMDKEIFDRHTEENQAIINENKTLFKIDEIKRNGKTFGWFQIIKTPYKYEEEEKPLVLGIAVDISELKEMKEKLEKEKEKAVQANRAKSQFLANMSHEIRTPLNAIIGFGDLILQSDLNRVQYRYTENIKKSAKALLDIVNDILDLSKIEAGKLELEFIKENIIEITKETGELIRNQAEEKGLRFVVDIKENVPKYAIIDPLRLKQILINLLSNALKFTLEGEIKLSLSFYQGDEKGIFHFEIRDSGMGISEEKQEKLFEAFYQGDISNTRKFGGTGLGLAITKNLLWKMGSRIILESEEGKGSIFSFDIETEYSNNQEIKETKVEESLGIISENKIKILVADDVYLNIELMKCIVKEFLPNSEIISASNGLEAIDILKKENPFLIFMDVQMPKLDGISATKEIREYEKINSGRRTAIVALTAGAIKGDKEKVLEAGMDDFMSKPVSQNEIHRILKKYINTYLDIDRDKKQEFNYDKKYEENNILKNIDLYEFCLEFYGLDIEEGLERSMGKAELYLKLLENFNKKLRIIYGNMGREIRKENYEELAKLSHKISGVSGTLSAKGIYYKARKFEEICKNKVEKEEVRELFKELKIEIEKFEKALDIVRNIFGTLNKKP
jgi:PAS domain S-box-containing protein